MPMIDVYAVEGTFADKHALAKELATAVMRWEQVPDLAERLVSLRGDDSQSWSIDAHETPDPSDRRPSSCSSLKPPDCLVVQLDA